MSVPCGSNNIEPVTVWNAIEMSPIMITLGFNSLYEVEPLQYENTLIL